MHKIGGMNAPKLKSVSVEAGLAAVQAQINELAAQLARGTREQPATPIRTTALPLVAKVAALLRTEPLDTVGLTSKLGAPAARVRAALAQLREDKLVYNVGSDIEPKWVHVLGDNGPAAELRARVLTLISIRPFSHRELVVVTGARDNRISGALADLREDRQTRVVNLGDGSRGRWLVLPADLKLATLRRS